MTNANIEQLRKKADEAQAHEQALFTEADALPGLIAEAAREDVQARAAMAREGGAVATAVKASEVPALQDRMASLRYELWATQLFAAECAKQLHAEEEAAALAEEPAVMRELKAAQAAHEAADHRHGLAMNAAGGPERKANYARRQLLEAEERIKALEAKYPADA
jgi:hypothetical protein